MLLTFDSCRSSGGSIRRRFATVGNLTLDPHQTGPSILQLGLYFSSGAAWASSWRWSANHGAICELNEANTFRRGSSPNGFDQVWGGSTMGRNTMVRSLILTAALTMGLSTVASAGFTPHPIGNSEGLLTRVAEGCGPGWWRGPGGRCHPMARGRVCPRVYHLGPEGGRCWPN